MFRLSYDQAKKLVNRGELFSTPTYNGSTFGSRFISAFLMTIFMGPLAMILGIGTSNSLEELFRINIPLISHVITPVITILISVTVIGYWISVIAPRRNIASFNMRSNVLLFGLIISVPVVVFPLTFGTTVYLYGLPTVILQAILLLIYILFKIRSYRNEVREKIFNGQLKKSAIDRFNLKITVISLVVIDLVSATFRFVMFGHISLKLVLLDMMFQLLMLMAIYLVLVYTYNKLYKASYIVKYAREFQYDWKITDKDWWFTAKRAAKHPRVYPPVEEGTKEPTPKEGNKHG